MRYRRTLVICLILLCPFSARALVNINTASLDELDTLPGVGPATAQKIVNTRPFSATSDIQNVQGIGGPGSKTYEDIIGLITVSGATTVVVEDSEDGSSTKTESSSAKSDKDDVDHHPVSSLNLKMPSIAYAGQVVDFDVEPVGGTDGRLVRYWWNFGDGSTSAEKNPSHQYRRPGTYVVVVESYFQKATKMARGELLVLPLALRLNALPGGGVEVVNKGEHEIDLSGLTLSGRGDFVFPRHSVLLSGKGLTVESVSGPTVTLKDEFSRPLAFSTVSEPLPTRAGVTSPTRPQAARQSAPPAATSTTSTTASLGPEKVAADELTNNNAAAVASTSVPPDAWPYLGLLALMGFGLVALFGVKQT